jgi:transposase
MLTRKALSLRWHRAGLRGEVREYGRIANTAAALDRLLRKLGADGMALRFCYEAGPCGYGIQR